MLSQCIINAKHSRRKSTLVYKRNRKQHVLAVIVGFFAAIPVICLPIGIRAGVSPALIISKAYAQVFGIQEGAGTIVEAQDIVGEGVVLADVSNGTFDTGAQAAAAEQEVSYSDVPKYIVYQEYDQSNLPIELLDVQCFAADNTTYYIRANNSILKEIPNMDSYTICTLHLGQEVTRIGIGDTWSKIQTEDGQEGYVLTDSIQDTMLEISIDRTVWVDTDSLIVRAEPSTQSDQVTVVNDEDKLVCSAIVGDKWYKVTTPSGAQGYVYISYTTQTPPPTPTPTPTPKPTEAVTEKELYLAVYATTTINVRKGPGTEYDVVKNVFAGDQIDVIAVTSNGWYKTYNGNYVKKSLTTETKPTNTPTPKPKPTSKPTSSTTAKPTSAPKPSGEGNSCKITFYGPQPTGNGGYSNSTATGTTCTEGRTCAADWSIYPAGTVIYIENDPLGGDGYYTVEDRGPGVKGYHIDIYADDGESGNYATCYRTVYVK